MAETPEFQEFGKFMEVIREYSLNPLDVTMTKKSVTLQQVNQL